MRISKKKQALQRQVIERKIQRFAKLNEPIPTSGWVKAIRGSLGMTTKQLAQRLGTSPASVTQLEEREPEKKVTLETLERAANAMGCTLVYAIVPMKSHTNLESIIEDKARELALRIFNEVNHSMRLEAQGISKEESKEQIEAMARELKLKADSRIWDLAPPPATRKKGRK